MRRGRTRSREHGFTLIELVVVLAVLGLALSLVLLRGPARSPTLQFDSAVRQVAGALRVARSRAIAEDRLVTVAVIDHSLLLGSDAAVPLASALLVSGDSRISFAPDGGSSGGHVALRMGERLVVIDVDWLTGRVRLSRQD